jgi:ATP-dependent Clp protease adaptor protein ClpS
MPTLEALPTIDVDALLKTLRPWKVILYNDDIHSMDEVVFQLQKATGCSLEKAYHVMEEAHTRGRAVCYSGPKDDCEKVGGVLRQIRLQVELDQG